VFFQKEFVKITDFQQDSTNIPFVMVLPKQKVCPFVCPKGLGQKKK
jgi:hypothetical protein